MKATNLLKKLEAKSLLVIDDSSPESKHNRRFYAIANGRKLTVCTQGDEVATMRVASIRDQDDIVSDYFAGSYWDTLPQVFRAMGI